MPDEYYDEVKADEPLTSTSPLTDNAMLPLSEGTIIKAVGEPDTIYIRKAKFGGNGEDGAIHFTEDFTYDFNSANVLVKNYTSLIIDSGTTISVSNPASDGSILWLRVTGDVTINGKIDLKGAGADGGTTDGQSGTSSWITFGENPSGGSGGTSAGGGGGGASMENDGSDGGDGGGGAASGGLNSDQQPITEDGINIRRYFLIAPGSGGGAGDDGGGNHGDGGKGGGGLIIECGGNLTYGSSSEIDLEGNDGSNGDANGGGGGGGGCGTGLILYNFIYVNNGLTETVGASSGGTGFRSGGNGAAGTLITMKNIILP